MTHLIVELAGPAGAGKTTLAATLRGHEGTTIVGVDASWCQLSAGLATAAPWLVAARASSRGRGLTRAEARSIAYLAAWPGALRRTPHEGLRLLDHGPLFRMAALEAHGPPMCRTSAFHRWRDGRVRTWGQLLDVIIWLDAPDDVLLGRIGRRAQPHRVQGVPRGEAEAFLAAYRRTYRETLLAIADAGTQVVYLDTGVHPPDELAGLVMESLDPLFRGRPR